MITRFCKFQKRTTYSLCILLTHYLGIILITVRGSLKYIVKSYPLTHVVLVNYYTTHYVMESRYIHLTYLTRPQRDGIFCWSQSIQLPSLSIFLVFNFLVICSGLPILLTVFLLFQRDDISACWVYWPYGIFPYINFLH